MQCQGAEYRCRFGVQVGMQVQCSVWYLFPFILGQLLSLFLLGPLMVLTSHKHCLQVLGAELYRILVSGFMTF